MTVSDIDQLISVIALTDKNLLSYSRTVKRFSIGGRSLKGTVPHSDQPATSALTSEAQVESRQQINVVSGSSRVRASAAFLGLAIVSGILIPEGSQATTASSVDVPTPQMHPTSDSSSNSQAIENQDAAATETESSSEWQPSLLRTLSDLNQSEQHLEPNTADAVPSFKQSKPKVAEGSPEPQVPAISSESFSPSTTPTQNSFQVVEPTNAPPSLNLESDETAASENSDRYTPHQAVYPRSGTNTPSSITTPKVPGAVVIDSELSDQSVSVVYQVSSGETLAQIAQNHNISVGEIIAANDLADPNFIEVNQKLKIPQRSAAAIRRSKFGASQQALKRGLGSPSTQRSRSRVIPSVIPSEIKAQTHKSLGSSLKPDSDQNKLSLDQLASIKTNGQVSRPTVIQPRAIEVQSSSDPQSIQAVSQSDAEMEFQLALAQKSDLQPESTSGLYTHRLRADVDRLRQEYQAQKAAKLANASELTPDTQSEEGVTPTSNHQPLLLRRINPEFDPDAYRRQKAAPGEKAEPPQPYAQEVELTPQANATDLSAPQQSAEETNYPEPVVATAPLGSSAYDPLQNPALGKIVSPDLPPLAGPDTYLPGGSMRFNGHIWPSRGILSSGYGWRWGRMHRGIDIAAPIGTPIVASAPGVVIYAGWNSGGYGNLVEIEHPDGSVTVYAHNSRILVNKGQKVTQGQQISEMGSTGRSTGPHLHFEIHPSGNGAVNPMALLPRERDNVGKR